MNGLSVTAVFIGAGLGALLRWALGTALNPLFPALPLGTLAANLLGGLLVGTAAALFAWKPALSPTWHLFVVTGFLGGLTTFSTFSVEVVTLLGRREPLWALGTMALHLFGSLALTAAGMLLGRALWAGSAWR